MEMQSRNGAFIQVHSRSLRFQSRAEIPSAGIYTRPSCFCFYSSKTFFCKLFIIVSESSPTPALLPRVADVIFVKRVVVAMSQSSEHDV